MAHEVSFALPDRALGSAALEIGVRKDDTKLGRLKASKGAVVWVPGGRTYGYKMSWVQLAALFEEYGEEEKRAQRAA
jgi:hypothetical protein